MDLYFIHAQCVLDHETEIRGYIRGGLSQAKPIITTLLEENSKTSKKCKAALLKLQETDPEPCLYLIQALCAIFQEGIYIKKVPVIEMSKIISFSFFIINYLQQYNLSNSLA